METKEITPALQLEQLLQAFINDLKSVGVTFVGLNLEVGREHFSPERQIHLASTEELNVDYQEFTPETNDIETSVLLRARD
jgi:hypothetical protein